MKNTGGAYKRSSKFIKRINGNFPYPVLCHPFVRSTLEETIEGIREIALSGVLDVISIRLDLNDFEDSFTPFEPGADQQGICQLTISGSKDIEAIRDASQCGNFPLLQFLTGTNDLLNLLTMGMSIFNNAWGIMPLCLNNMDDMRSAWSPGVEFKEVQQVMRFYSHYRIPVWFNESQQWNIGPLHDSLAITVSYLAAYNAKRMGVREYIIQLMFNQATGTTPLMDIARMAAEMELIGELEDEMFHIYKAVEADFSHFSSIPQSQNERPAAAAILCLALRPHILTEVNDLNNNQTLTVPEIISKCQIAKDVMRDAMEGSPEILSDMQFLTRKGKLVYEARILLESFKFFGTDCEDPMSDPDVIAEAIRWGIIDIPRNKENQIFRGEIITGLVDGGWDAIDPETGNSQEEEARLSEIFKRIKKSG